MRALAISLVMIGLLQAGGALAQSPEGEATPEAPSIADEPALVCQTEVQGPPLFESTLVGTADHAPPEEYLHADPCGLRMRNLSGLWRDNWGRQYIAVHDPRAGTFSMRYGFIPEDDRLREVWSLALGDAVIEGMIHRDRIALIHVLVYPPEGQRACPDFATVRLPSSTVILNLDAGGNPEVRVTYAQHLLDYASCTERFNTMLAVTYTLEKLDP